MATLFALNCRHPGLLALAMILLANATSVAEERDIVTRKINGFELIEDRAQEKALNGELNASAKEHLYLVHYADTEFPDNHWTNRRSKQLAEEYGSLAARKGREREPANELFLLWARALDAKARKNHDAIFPPMVQAIAVANSLGLKDSLIVMRMLDTVASEYERRNDRGNLIKSYVQYLEIADKLKLSSSPTVISARLNLVATLLSEEDVLGADIETRKVEVAMAELEKGIHIRQRARFDRAMMNRYSAAIDFALGNYQQAGGKYKEYFRFASMCDSPVASEWAMVGVEMTAAHAKALAGEAREAADNAAKIAKSQEELQPRNESVAALNLIRSAEIMVLAGRLDEAAADIERSLQLGNRAFGPSAPWLARHQFAHGRLEIARGNVEAGRKLLNDSVNALIREFGEHSLGLIRTLQVVEDVERKAGGVQRAEELARIRTRLETTVGEHRKKVAPFNLTGTP